MYYQVNAYLPCALVLNHILQDHVDEVVEAEQGSNHFLQQEYVQLLRGVIVVHRANYHRMERHTYLIMPCFN